MSGDFLIGDAAAAAGCTPEELRIWGLRYGWPQPRRSSGGYRMFSPTTVATLCRVVALRNAGTPISSLIVDGAPHLPPTVHQRPVPVDLTGLPRPAGLDGRDLCVALTSAIRRGLTPAEVRHIAEVRMSRVNPVDRGAVLALVQRYEDHHQTGAVA